MFNARWFVIPFLILQTFPALLILRLIKRIDLFHCRSYPVSISALAVKKLIETKLVFDPRSPFPEENVAAGRWTERSMSYKMWKGLEKIFLRESDAVIAVTGAFLENFRNISSTSNILTIPNNVSLQKFKRDEAFRKSFRSGNNIDHDKLVFCYCGNLGEPYWHSVRTYGKYIIKCREMDTSPLFLFITPEGELLTRSFALQGILPNEYLCVSSSFADVPKYLSAADFGIIFMDKKDIRMSIKTAEYLAMGLPVIANSNVVGAKRIIEENSVGLVFEIESDIKIIDGFLYQYFQAKEKHQAHCRKVAFENFSNDLISEKYSGLYQKLLK
jgi:glycosyltransferase involved in cell wall biosynthesis